MQCKLGSEVISWINLELLSLILFIDDGQRRNSGLVFLPVSGIEPPAPGELVIYHEYPTFVNHYAKRPALLVLTSNAGSTIYVVVRHTRYLAAHVGTCRIDMSQICDKISLYRLLTMSTLRHHIDVSLLTRADFS